MSGGDPAEKLSSTKGALVAIEGTDDRFSAVSDVWARYGELTRFLESARIAIERERSLWESADFVAAESIQIRSCSIGGAGTYRVQIDQHLATLGDPETLSGLVLLGTCSAAEELARIALKTERLPTGGVEKWGPEALRPNGHDLNEVKGGKAQIVSVYQVRNAVVHGHRAWTEAMVSRVIAAGGSPPAVGSKVEVAPVLATYRSCLRSFMQLTGLTTA